MRLMLRYILLLVVAVATLAGCRRAPAAVPDAVPAAVYYWRTTMSLDSAERDFLTRHDVGKMYVRFFDVVMRHGAAQPNATIAGLDSVPAGIRIVPVVFIMENCLSGDTTGLAARVVQRVAQMCDTHGINADELQIDCDWTLRSKRTLYDILERMRSHTRRLGWRLSATIRLHQLAMDPPPVDYGVLMMYNTGDVRSADGTNPILDASHVAPYLHYLDDYRLPLCAAYPCFGWQLLYQRGEFKAILYSANLDDTTMYREVRPGRYIVVRRHATPEYNSDRSGQAWIEAGDSVIVMRPSADLIVATRDRIAAHRPEMNAQIILYSLNSQQMNHYNNTFYETIYNP